MTPLQEELVARVRDGLTSREWNQADLAFATGISEKHLSQMMTGKAEGTLTMWQMILFALGPTAGTASVRGEGDG